jgi:hypothetical protein
MCTRVCEMDGRCVDRRQWQQGKRGRGESILAKAEAISSVLDAFMRGARREGQVAVSLHTFSSSTFLIISGVAEFTGGASMKRCWIGVSGCKTQGNKTEWGSIRVTPRSCHCKHAAPSQWKFAISLPQSRVGYRLETHVGLGWRYVRARSGHWQANLVELGMPVPRNVKVFHGDLRGRAGVQSGVFQASDGKRQEVRNRH